MGQQSLHHIGYVVSSIAAVGARFAKSVAATWDGRIIHDPLQKVLVEPSGEDSPVLAFLSRGGGLHHLCYEVDDLDLHLRQMRTQGSVPARPPLPAVAFDGRRIAWMLTPDRLLLEFLERGMGPDSANSLSS